MCPGISAAPPTGRRRAVITVVMRGTIQVLPLSGAVDFHTLCAVSLNPHSRPVSDGTGYEESCCRPQVVFTSLNLIPLLQSILHLLIWHTFTGSLECATYWSGYLGHVCGQSRLIPALMELTYQGKSDKKCSYNPYTSICQKVIRAIAQLFLLICCIKRKDVFFSNRF